MTQTANYAAMSKPDLITIIESQKLTINYERAKRKQLEDALSNNALPINLRLAAIAAKRLEETAKPDENGYYRAHLPALAEMVGVSPSTMSRGLKNLADCTQAVEHRTVDDKDEPYKKIVYIRPSDLLDRPGEIAPIKEIKRHGGDHRCKCGGELHVKERILTSQQYIECSNCGITRFFPPRIVNDSLAPTSKEVEEMPLQDATGRDEQEQTDPLHLATGQTTADEEETPCNLQPITTYTLSHCKMQGVPAIEELHALPQWVCWRYERAKNGKLTKVPYDAKKPAATKPKHAKASTTDELTWASYEQAKARYEESQTWKLPYDGIGFVFNGDYTGIDLDHCIDQETGELSEGLLDTVALFNSYAELSPSRTGVHIIVRGSIPTGVHRPEIEMYCRGRFFTITSEHLPGTPHTIEDCQAELDSLYDELKPKPTIPLKNRNARNMPSPLSDDEILEKAMNAFNGAKFEALYEGSTIGYPSQSEADLALCNHLAYWTNDDASAIDRLFRRSGLYRREKWDRPARTGETYGEGTIRIALGEEMAS
jgi:hypothetical protein